MRNLLFFILFLLAAVLRAQSYVPGQTYPLFSLGWRVPKPVRAE